MKQFLLSENTRLIIEMLLAVSATSSAYIATYFYKKIRRQERENTTINEIKNDVKKLLNK